MRGPRPAGRECRLGAARQAAHPVPPGPRGLLNGAAEGNNLLPGAQVGVAVGDIAWNFLQVVTEHSLCWCQAKPCEATCPQSCAWYQDAPSSSSSPEDRRGHTKLQ